MLFNTYRPFIIAPTSLPNTTQSLKWVYRQYRGKIVQARSAHSLLGTPQAPVNDTGSRRRVTVWEDEGTSANIILKLLQPKPGKYVVQYVCP